MSHWTTTKLVGITDEAALCRAAEAMGLTVIRGAYARGYANNRRKADIVLRLPGDAYDIAVSRADDGLQLATDWYGGSVVKVVGNDYSRLMEFYQSEICGATATQSGQQWWRVASEQDAQRVNQELGLWGAEAIAYDGHVATVIGGGA